MLIVRIALMAVVCMQAAGYSQSNPKPAKDRQGPRQAAATSLPVQLRAVVTNSAGQFVQDLTKEDFALTEDGALQTIASFSMMKIDGKSDALPSLRKESAQAAPAVSSPPLSRVIVLLIDTAHISGGGIERVRMALTNFIDEQKGEQDLIALVTSTGKPGVTGEFTADRSKLKADLKKIRQANTEFESFLTPVLCGKVVQRDPQAVNLASLIIDSEERTSGSVQAPQRGNVEAEAVSNCRMRLLETASRRRALMSAIGAAVEKMSGWPGPHMLALFTEGFSMVATGGDIAISEVRPAISIAIRAGVMIYTFDAKDPLTSKQVNIESYSLSSEILNSMRDLQHGTSLLAGQTGGDAFFNLDGLSDQLQKMLDANHVGYYLSYSPAPAADPRKLRSIGISVKGHPDYQVRAAKGFDMTAPGKAK
jgi:VWFA-related protein